MTCDHFECQCMRAVELSTQGRTMEAVEVHRKNQRVPCRRRVRCLDCGEPGKLTGHQECQYPGDSGCP